MTRRNRGANSLILTEPTPCSPCLHAARCARDLLACDEYQRYIGTNGSLAWRGPRIEEARRFPTRATYVKVHAHHPTKAESAWRMEGRARIQKRGAP